ncbi:unnamed protein product [Toxocara canis]|uniref:Uncharacterized protein n=1 Tax=Toxocara canis TaxID=6265 RepID=A0A183V1S6_TOXCA|nr:unnamed protein product [Toxocara canis]
MILSSLLQRTCHRRESRREAHLARADEGNGDQSLVMGLDAIASDAERGREADARQTKRDMRNSGGWAFAPRRNAVVIKQRSEPKWRRVAQVCCIFIDL